MATTYARFRLSSTGVAGPGGAAVNGEVEDYALTTIGLDFGDAADPTYPTLLASNGARHQVLPTGNPTLGSTVDTEANGQPNAALTGDDLSGADDEDGVVFPATLIPGTNGTVQITAGATGGLVSCWIDFTRDGDWNDAGEQVVAGVAVGSGATLSPTFAVPVGSPQGTAPSRCRISSQAGLGVTGAAPDGEIEDHPAPIGVEDPQIGVAKRLVSVERDAVNHLVFRVTLEIRVENMGNVPLSNVQVTESLAAAFTGAASFSVVSLQSADLTVNPAFDGAGNTDLLAAGNSLAVGTAGIINLVVQVDSGGNGGPYSNQVVAEGDSPAGTPVTDISQDGDDPDPDDDGDPDDNNEPTPIVFQIHLFEIPTLGTWGLLALMALLAMFALRRLRPAGN